MTVKCAAVNLTKDVYAIPLQKVENNGGSCGRKQFRMRKQLMVINKIKELRTHVCTSEFMSIDMGKTVMMTLGLQSRKQLF